MAGLVSYGSSDEENDAQAYSAQQQEIDEPSTTKNKPNGGSSGIQANGNQQSAHEASNADSANPPLEQDTPLSGPILGPAIPTQEPFPISELPGDDQAVEDAPQSPYSAGRALLRDLTLPSIPNYDIPPSPPGSPVASTNSKFKHFLELKNKGVHFNEKLARSSALKNPSLMQKLMDFSGIAEAGQYAATLSKDLWDPNAFPEYAYKEELAKSQQKILKRKEDEKARGQRDNVDFVPASPSGDPINRNGTSGAGGKASQKSAAERIMAGLDRTHSSSPRVQGVKRKSRFDT